MQTRAQARHSPRRIASLNDEKLRSGMQMGVQDGSYSGQIASLSNEKQRSGMQMGKFYLYLRQRIL